jgi:hypothetical protein
LRLVSRWVRRIRFCRRIFGSVSRRTLTPERIIYAAPDEFHYHKAYQFGAVRYYAQALIERGRRDEVVNVLFYYYSKRRDRDIAVMLLLHFWNSEKCGNPFILNPAYD